ncbi:hypothetical protein MML48_2g00005411 [Holotrichia oblita]|uniref:Uncharacterized protein n=1 Tax=Holotrichia oblita TaxID=644536 RepID=A0ACB9TM23_HOLOL|nr:hypothetical protein MML48_2g00005411 [Holotrichia oblita]
MPGKRWNSQSQELVLNVLEYFEREKENGGPTLPVNAVYERVCDALHISRQTVYAIKQRKMRNPILSSPGKKRPRAKPKTKDLREPSKMEVRNTVYMYKERKHVTLHTLKDQLKTKDIVSLSTKSLATLMKNIIGFKQLWIGYMKTMQIFQPI